MLVIDAYNMIYRAAGVACSKPESEYIYKSLHKTFLQIFFKMFNRIFRDYKHEKIIIAWDSQGTFRKNIYPEYKGNRANTLKEKTEEAFPFIREGLEKYGCTIIEMENQEADDIIYAICKSQINEKITIISGDKDYIQLINENVRVFSPNTNKFHLKPNYDYVMSRAIEGDASDNINGLYGYGPKKSASVLNNFETFWKVLSESDRNIIERNIKLMDLSKNPDKNKIIEYVTNEIKNCKNTYNFQEIKNFVFKHKLIEIYGNLKSELGEFM